MDPPFLFWAPSIALSGMTFYTGEKFPQWEGNIFVGGLVGQQLQMLQLLQQRPVELMSPFVVNVK